MEEVNGGLKAARVEGLRAEIERLCVERRRINEQIVEKENLIGWVMYHDAYPVGGTFQRRGATYKVVSHHRWGVVALRIKKDGLPSVRVSKIYL